MIAYKDLKPGAIITYKPSNFRKGAIYRIIDVKNGLYGGVSCLLKSEGFTPFWFEMSQEYVRDFFLDSGSETRKPFTDEEYEKLLI